MSQKRPELLIPASSLEVLKTAVMFGADAVYIGGEAFGLRAKAKNFSMEDMKKGVEFAHAHGVKVHVTVNILAHNDDLPGVEEYLKELKEVGPDALIIADPGVFELAKEICPEIQRHVSTQANNTNYATYQFWWKQGASRVVSARELSLREIKEIRERIPAEMEIEALFTEQCVYHIPEDVCLVISLPVVTQIREHARIRAAGNIPSWKRRDRESICLSMKMSVEHTFSTQKTYA